MKLDDAIATALDAIPQGTEIEVEYEPATSTSSKVYRGAYAGRWTSKGQSYFAINAKGHGQRIIQPRKGRILSFKVL